MADFTKLAQQLVKFNTGNSQVKEAIGFLSAYLKNIGFKVEIIKSQSASGEEISNLFASYGKGKPSLLLAGHIDTVSPGDLREWKYAPFSATVRDGRLYGRGAVDMKGGLACLVAACEDFIARPFGGCLSLAVSGDGESAHPAGMSALMQYAHQNGHKFDFCIFGKPSGALHLGDAIRIGRRGCMAFEITSYGKMGHPAYPEQADNPLHNLISLLFKLKSSDLDNGNEHFGPSTLQVTSVEVSRPLPNLLPLRAMACIEVFFNNNQTPDGIIKQLQSNVNFSKGEFEVKYELKGDAYVFPKSAETELLRALTMEETGQNTIYSTSGGLSDARFIKDLCPVVELGLNASSVHQVNENVKLEDLYILQRIYGEFLQKYFSSASGSRWGEEIGNAV